jgi:glycosyltransferase involved in cell wall biosynthesis
MNIFYKIWVDCVLGLRSQKQNKDTWIEKSMFSMTICMVFNFLLFTAVVGRHIVDLSFYEIKMSSPNIVVPVERANNILTFLILYVLPCFVINYLLIFRKKRLKKLIRKYKYPYYKGKLFVIYMLISLLLPCVLLFIFIFTTQDVTFWDFFRR